ncbi:mannonate dehydratase [Phaeobacter sp. B1627]|uniref:mannonate dehydratase n=1 Tax=Phaeobacter sp. B1627 TaxID=2583809 RepID=UPI00111ADA32|nr:mannonate dehydratase [Phaeobacter sp. B1627]TNJ39607.1 mannonate dehydratase [Phaeobacter sp. B1627]
MKQTWRWFGPADEITISEVRMTGAEGIVSALHHVPTGNIWSQDEIRQRQGEISHFNGRPTGLQWDVVESLVVSEQIKSQSGNYRDHFENYRQSLRNLAACGLRTVCYNFMPVLDWTRTELTARLEHGGTAMRFDLVDFAAFDLFILARPAAVEDYSDEFQETAKQRFATMPDDAKLRLSQNIVAGLPGANENWTLDALTSHLDVYRDIDRGRLQANLVDFLSEVVPTAEDLGIRLCCHPDDPPFSLLGLPRVMSSEGDYKHILDAVDSSASGATLCTGSLGVASDFDAVRFVENLGHRIHFVHLRNTKRHEPSDGRKTSFHESEHLDGDSDVVGAVHALMREERRRRTEGREDHIIPMRPDHGHSLVSDLDRPMMPGYPLVGRLRGLAELRGIMSSYDQIMS